MCVAIYTYVDLLMNTYGDECVIPPHVLYINIHIHIQYVCVCIYLYNVCVCTARCVQHMVKGGHSVGRRHTRAARGWSPSATAPIAHLRCRSESCPEALYYVREGGLRESRRFGFLFGHVGSYLESWLLIWVLCPKCRFGDGNSLINPPSSKFIIFSSFRK